MLVWLLTGFWHGAEWNFIVWGIYFGILLILEKLFIMKILKKIPAIFHHFYLLFLVLIGFVIFNANNLSTALTNIYGLFGGLDIPLINSETIYYLRNYLVIVVVAMIASTPLLSKIVTKLKEKAKGLKALQVVEPILLSLLLFIEGCLISFNLSYIFRFLGCICKK